MGKVLFIITLIFLFNEGLNAREQNDSIRCRVYFQAADTALEPGYENNCQKLDSLCTLLQMKRRNSKLLRIRITSGASPEGSTQYNKWLSKARGEALCSYLQKKLQIPDSVFVIDSRGQDWEELEFLVGRSDMPFRNEVLRILRETPEWVVRGGVVQDSRKRQLMRLRGGEVWQYMYRHFFPELRNSSVIECDFDEYVLPVDDTLMAGCQDTVVSHDTVGLTEMIRDTVVWVAEKENSETGTFGMALKSNLLYDVCLIPNAGVEFYLGKGWTVQTNWMYSWWKSDKRHLYWRIYGGDLGIRKYFGKASWQRKFTGHHIGVYGQVLTYDFETGGRGYIGGVPGGTIFDKALWGGGMEYGYSKAIGRRLNLDFSLGLGYLGGENYEYLPVDNRYVWQATRKLHWFGPTRLEITLVWLLGNCKAGKAAEGGR